MRLAWATDIHWSHAAPEARQAFFQQVLATQAQGLLITGDIAEAKTYLPALEMIRAAVKLPVAYVLGNHDFYGSSIQAVRGFEQVRQLQGDEGLTYLRATPRRYDDFELCAIDGWADMRFGDPGHTRVQLADEFYIAELQSPTLVSTIHRRRRLGDQEQEIFSASLDRTTGPTIVVATHVPPYAQAAWHEGKMSGDEWLPYFTCKAVGEVIDQHAAEHPENDYLVLCGHSHSGGSYLRAPNICVVTGAAVYGHPSVCGVIDVVDGKARVT